MPDEPKTREIVLESESLSDPNPGEPVQAQRAESEAGNAAPLGKPEMNVKEYREFLAAVEKRYVQLASGGYGIDGVVNLKWQIDRLTSLARLVHAVEGRPEDTAWYVPLGNALSNRLLVPVDYTQHIMHETGIADALDQHGEIIFGGLSREAIPNDDISLIQSSGIYEAEAEVTIIIHQLRQIARSGTIRASAILREAPEALDEAIQTLPKANSDPSTTETEKKPRKYFTGIGRILSGAVAGAGNILIGIGTIPASGGATAGAVIASSALAVGLMLQGIGDLRGE
jgi:hypothetical protein